MKYYIDGFTIGKNPSKVGGGYSIVDENNTLLKVENIKKVGMTNNEAELRGLQACLQMVSLGDTISTDSMNTIAWVRTRRMHKIARQDLVPVILECQAKIFDFGINLLWEGREHNLAGIYNEDWGIDTGHPEYTYTRTERPGVTIITETSSAEHESLLKSKGLY